MNYEYRTSYWWQVIIVAYENCVFGYRCIVHDWSFLNAYIFEKKERCAIHFKISGQHNYKYMVHSKILDIRICDCWWSTFLFKNFLVLIVWHTLRKIFILEHFIRGRSDVKVLLAYTQFMLVLIVVFKRKKDRLNSKIYIEKQGLIYTEKYPTFARIISTVSRKFRITGQII